MTQSLLSRAKLYCKKLGIIKIQYETVLTNNKLTWRDESYKIDFSSQYRHLTFLELQLSYITTIIQTLSKRRKNNSRVFIFIKAQKLVILSMKRFHFLEGCSTADIRRSKNSANISLGFQRRRSGARRHVILQLLLFPFTQELRQKLLERLQHLSVTKWRQVQIIVHVLSVNAPISLKSITIQTASKILRKIL